MSKETASAHTFEVHRSAAQLTASLESLLWGLEQIPEPWLRQPLEKGGWDVAMNLAHMAVYEEKIALPVLESVLRGGNGDVVQTGDESWFERDSRVFSAEPVDVIVERLKAVRRSQVDAVSSFTVERFNESVVSLWSEHLRHSAGWVAAKTFQHTWEHGNFLLRVALFSPLFSKEAQPARDGSTVVRG